VSALRNRRTAQALSSSKQGPEPECRLSNSATKRRKRGCGGEAPGQYESWTWHRSSFGLCVRRPALDICRFAAASGYTRSSSGINSSSRTYYLL